MSSTEILLADKDRYFAEIYQEFLEENDFSVSIKDSQDSAFQLAKQKQPSLVLTEILLKNGDGFELTKQLKKDGETSFIPVVFFSCLGEKSDVDQAFKLGAENFLIKQHNDKQEVLKLLNTFK
jgi:PleD family two-component response regulator